MNYLAFFAPLIEEVVQLVGGTALADLNALLGSIAQKNGVALAPTPAHTAPAAPGVTAPPPPAPESEGPTEDSVLPTHP